jgi:LmbE family N-acetylglucosaminyl deacetylase
VTHVFVSPHPDDAALSCGGLIARLRERGEPVTIVTVFCGPGNLDRLTPYQRLALGFGSREKRQPGDDAATLGSADLAEADAARAVSTPEQVMAVRRAEDESFARIVGASIAFLNLPDAVFRGYEGDTELLGEPRSDDPAPIEQLRAYDSQLGRLFGGDNPMARDVREHARRVGELGGVGPSERYWRVTTS